MLIPIKCFTCGKVLADKQRYYERKLKEENMNNKEKTIYLTPENIQKTNAGKILDDLGLTKMCCRRHMLCHVDIE